MIVTRQELRIATAAELNSLSRKTLFRAFGITRIGDVTGLDTIGVPVLTACRPAAKSVSISAGKSMDRQLARAGAIAEAIELSVFERPGPHQIGLAHPLDYPLAQDSGWTPQTPVAVEPIKNFLTGETVAFPSALIWLIRPKGEPIHFQNCSSGQATGGSFADAMLQAIYECVERDQYVLSRLSLQRLRLWPARAAFEHPAVSAVERAGLKLFLFYCTVDIAIPVYFAVIVDLSWLVCGGWGAHINPRNAAERAVLEAIQSRGVAISGARDDLERRDPDWVGSIAAIKELDALPFIHLVRDLESEFSVADELKLVLERLGQYWLSRTWYKHRQLCEAIHVVKVRILGLEQIVMPYWKEIRWTKLLREHEQSMSAQACMERVASLFQGSNGSGRPEPAISLPKSVLNPPRIRSS